MIELMLGTMNINEYEAKTYTACSYYRVYPSSEFVVANTIAKWKKLEPNEINFSHGFSQKVISSCFVFNSLPARGDLSANNLAKSLCKQFGRRSGPTFCRA